MSDQHSLFDDAPLPAAHAAQSGALLRDIEDVRKLGAQIPPSMFLGTSTWTYAGWKDIVYSREYKKSETAQMLEEFARYPLFRTTCADSAYYRPMSSKVLNSYKDAMPSNFRLAQKVWDRITSFALGSPRSKNESGEPNPNFLHAGVFQREILDPSLQILGPNAGPFIFELEAIPAYFKISAEEFADRLHHFFSHLPRGPMYAVEIRNPKYLGPAYFAALKAHNVAHCFNSWTKMPGVGAQMAYEGAMDTADFAVCRALLKPGRTYVEAVQQFQPYDQIREPLPDVRQELVAYMDRAKVKNLAFLFLNNRLEGSAPLTIRWLVRDWIERQASP